MSVPFAVPQIHYSNYIRSSTSTRMKKVMITGTSGMIGQLILQHCLASDEVGEVISLVRKPSGKTHPKVREIVHTNFLDYTGLEKAFSRVDIAWYCLGVYTGALPDAQFREVTVDYTKAFAAALKTFSPQATCCLLSGAGADLKEQSKTPFARYKGMAENDLMRQGFGHLFIFRPGYIYPVEKRKEPNFAYRIFRTLYPIIRLLGEGMSIRSTELAQAMFLAGMHYPSQTILENKDILHFLRAGHKGISQ